MKKKILVLLALTLALMFTLGFSALAVSAEEAEPSVSIEKFNLAFEDNIYLKYAVKFTGIEDSEINADNIGMLYWTGYENGFIHGTENYSSKTTGYTTISGEKYYVFEYTHLAAKQLTDYIYAVAYLEYNGETYYSEPVKYSALEYAYNRLGKTSEGTTNEELKSLLNNMLTYGASAQQYFNYKEDRLATADFYQITLVGGTLDDGFTSGLYLSTDEVTITAPTELNEKSFSAWKNSKVETVSTDNPAIVSGFTANETYTATYTETSTYSEGLAFLSNGDGTCYVSGIGTCKDTDVKIPPTSPTGDSVTSIGNYAFENCTSLTSVTIGNNVTSIGNYAFSGCYKLVEVINKSSLNIVAGYTSYGNVAHYAKEVHNGESKIVNKDDYLFYTYNGVNYLLGYAGDDTALVLPESYNGENYEIYKYAFYECSLLTSVTIGNGVTNIGDYAFYRCDSLTSVTIPDGVTSIGGSAFQYCYKLVEVINKSSLNIVAGSSDYGYVAYYAKEVHNGESKIVNKDDYLFYTYNGVNYLLGYVGDDTVLALPESYNDENYEIYNYAFEDYSSLTSVTIGNSVTSIGDYAFRYCSSLTSVTIPDSVTSISSGAFWGCYKLVEVINKSSLKIVVGSSNYGYVAYYAKEVHNGESKIVNKDDYLFYTYNGVNYLVGCVGDDTTLVLPESYNGENYEINKYAFAYCHSLTNVTIPDSVTSIGNYAFYDCDSLTSVTIGNNVTSIGNYAFGDCYSLTSVTIGNSVTSIGNYAFSGCSSLTSVYITDLAKWCEIDFGYDANPLYYAKNLYLDGELVTELVIPEGVTSIGDYAFEGCSSLTSVTIGNSVTSIGYRAFSSCSSLTSVTIPDSVTSIGDFAFSSCSSLTSITIPDSVTSIGSSAFWSCTNLEFATYGNCKYLGNEDNPYFALIDTTSDNYSSFTIHEDTKLIADFAFYGCDRLTSISIPDSVTSIGNYAFYYCDSLTDVYYTGSEEEWAEISISSNNTYLTKATIHYNYEEN